MKIKLTETEKDRIRGMHAQYSSVQEQEQIQTNIDGIEMPEIEIPKDCMTCVTKALKNTGNYFGIDMSYDYTELTMDIANKLAEMYSEGLEEVDEEDLAELWEIAEDISPAHVILIGPKLMSCGRKCMVSTIIDNSKDFVLGID